MSNPKKYKIFKSKNEDRYASNVSNVSNASSVGKASSSTSISSTTASERSSLSNNSYANRFIPFGSGDSVNSIGINQPGPSSANVAQRTQTTSQHYQNFSQVNLQKKEDYNNPKPCSSKSVYFYGDVSSDDESLSKQRDSSCCPYLWCSKKN